MHDVFLGVTECGLKVRARDTHVLQDTLPQGWILCVVLDFIFRNRLIDGIFRGTFDISVCTKLVYYINEATEADTWV